MLFSYYLIIISYDKPFTKTFLPCWFDFHTYEVHLTGRAGQGHPPLQLRQYLLLQRVQLVPNRSSSSGHSVQFIAATVHQVVVDGEQGLIMDLTTTKYSHGWMWHIFAFTYLNCRYVDRQRNRYLFLTCVLLYRWSSLFWMLLMVSFMCGWAESAGTSAPVRPGL